MSSNIFPTLAGVQMGVERSVFYDTVIQREASGRELRIARQTSPRYRYRLSFDFLRQDSAGDEAATLQGFYLANSGPYDSFLFLDPYDSTVTNQQFGHGDTTTAAFRLQRTVGGTVSDLFGTWPVYTYSRTNLCTYSQAFDNAAWTKSDCTVGANEEIAPDGGGKTVDKLKETSSTSTHYVYTAGYMAPGAACVFSVYAKAAERSRLRLALGGANYADFNLSTVTTSNPTNCTPTITSIGDGWYRCSIYYSSSPGSVQAGVFILNNSGLSSYTGVAGEGLYVWNAQVETGATATRPIGTVTAVVTARPSFWPGGTDGYEPITYPLWRSVSVNKNGVATTAWTHGANGVITFTSAPSATDELYWSGSFYRVVRFDADTLDLQRRHSRIWKASVDLVSLIS
jgi:hypothetical protein